MSNYQFERDCRTPTSESYTILDDDTPVGRLDLHYTPTLVHATLCVVETDGDEPAEQSVKVLVPFHAQRESRDTLWRELRRVASNAGHEIELNWTVSTARRERLWTEPSPPTGIICVWFDSVAAAHEAFEPSSALRRVIETHTSDGVAYLIDQLHIRSATTLSRDA